LIEGKELRSFSKEKEKRTSGKKNTDTLFLWGEGKAPPLTTKKGKKEREKDKKRRGGDNKKEKEKRL